MNYEYFYSPSRAGFYPASFKRDYENSDNDWPNDAVGIDNEYYLLLIKGQSDGKRITCDDNGHPVLSESPVATKDELIALAESRKASLMRDATNIIAPLQDAVDLELATEAEKAQLVAWKTYRVLLNRVDISKAPDIEWPEAPEGEKTGN